MPSPPAPGSLPGLFDVLATRSGDRRWGWVWDWKEALPAAKKVFYGRVLRRKPTFISLEYVPHFFALTGNVGDPDDYQRLYDAGRLSYSARRIYELVAREGPLTTRSGTPSNQTGAGAAAGFCGLSPTSKASSCSPVSER